MFKEVIALNQDDIKPNIKTVLIISEGAHQESYTSRVEDVADRKIVIASPISRGRVINFYRGQDIRVEMALRGGYCFFNTPVIEQKKYPVPVFIIEQPEKVNRIQRREWVRIPIVADLDYSLVGEENKQSPYLKAKTVNISGGGVLLATNQEPNCDGMLRLSLKLPSMEIINITGRVARVVLGDERAPLPNKVGVEFVEIQKRVRDQLVQFINSKQREMIRMGQLQMIS